MPKPLMNNFFITIYSYYPGIDAYKHLRVLGCLLSQKWACPYCILDYDCYFIYHTLKSKTPRKSWHQLRAVLDVKMYIFIMHIVFFKSHEFHNLISYTCANYFSLRSRHSLRQEGKIKAFLISVNQGDIMKSISAPQATSIKHMIWNKAAN